MKSIAVALIVAFGLAAGLVACGGKSKKATTPTTTGSGASTGSGTGGATYGGATAPAGGGGTAMGGAGSPADPCAVPQ